MNTFDVSVVCLYLVLCVMMLTDCETKAQRELTQRQWIAGTNVLHRPTFGQDF